MTLKEEESKGINNKPILANTYQWVTKGSFEAENAAWGHIKDLHSKWKQSIAIAESNAEVTKMLMDIVRQNYDISKQSNLEVQKAWVVYLYEVKRYAEIYRCNGWDCQPNVPCLCIRLKSRKPSS